MHRERDSKERLIDTLMEARNRLVIMYIGKPKPPEYDAEIKRYDDMMRRVYDGDKSQGQ